MPTRWPASPAPTSVGVADYRAAFLRLDAAGQAWSSTTSRARRRIAPIQKYVFTGDPDGPRKIIEGDRLLRRGARLDVPTWRRSCDWFTRARAWSRAADRRRRTIIDTTLHRRPSARQMSSVRSLASRSSMSATLRRPCRAGRHRAWWPSRAGSWCWSGPRAAARARCSTSSAAWSRPTMGHGVMVEGHVAADCLNALTPVFQDFALLPWRSVARQRGAAAGRAAATAASGRAIGLRRCWRSPASPSSPAPGRSSCPAACGSGSASPARWRCGPRAC